MRYIIQNEREKGQAIVMVTLALMAMCGILGLAVDFGWAFYVKRAAQAAADTAALAAAQALRTSVGATGPYNCYQSCETEANPLVCTSSIVNDPNDNLDNACLYAKQNGFIDGGRQRVRVNEGSSGSINGTATPPTRTGLEVQYWVTVRVTESVPQLFSAVMGNPWATVSARATAAIMEAESEGSLRLTNREGDRSWSQGNNPVLGANLDGQCSSNGRPCVDAQGGVLMASACNGGNCSGIYAGRLQGNATVSAPFTNIRSTGDVNIPSPTAWTTTPVNGKADGGDFWDPTRGKAQPPITSSALTPCPIDGGVIDGTNGPVVLGPGYYYATSRRGQNVDASGAQITIRGDVTFGTGGSCSNGTSGPSTFGQDYMFFGGVRLTNQGNGATTLTFQPARYVFAGVQLANPNQNLAGTLFDASCPGNCTVTGTGQNGLGAMFIFTDGAGYPGLANHITTIGASGAQGGSSLQSSIAATLKQGIAGIQTGGNPGVTITLDGLNKANGTIPDELKPYNSVVMWQDRRNSTVKYEANGNIAASCGGNTATACQKISGELSADGVANDSPKLVLQGSPNVAIRGSIYQPRGAWTSLNGGGNLNSALQIVTGAVQVQGNANLILTPAPNTIPYSLVALVE